MRPCLTTERKRVERRKEGKEGDQTRNKGTQWSVLLHVGEPLGMRPAQQQCRK